VRYVECVQYRIQRKTVDCDLWLFLVADRGQVSRAQLAYIINRNYKLIQDSNTVSRGIYLIGINTWVFAKKAKIEVFI